MTGGILGRRKFAAIDEIEVPQNAHLKKPRIDLETRDPNADYQYQISSSNFVIAEFVSEQIKITLQTEADVTANTPNAAIDPQSLLSLLSSEIPQAQEIVRNGSDTTKPRDPMLSNNEPKDPRLSCNKSTIAEPSNQQKDGARRVEEQKKLFADRKLSLVLDLDHTLLHAIRFEKIDPVCEAILRNLHRIDRKKHTRELFRFAKRGYWLKLRPGVRNFLEKASKKFELHVNTMGKTPYAKDLVKVIDPTGDLFGGRITSRKELEYYAHDRRLPTTKNLNEVLGIESAALIIDDTPTVWPQNQQNLIQIKKYIYFPMDSKNQSGAEVDSSVLEIGEDESTEDGALASLVRLIESIHHNFFSSSDNSDQVDVRSILRDEQCKILQGCRILFSRIVPIAATEPQLHPFWIKAEKFGAICTNQMDDQITHVVARSLGTEKVNWAQRCGRFVVAPNWLEASAFSYKRACEQNFALKRVKKQRFE